MKYLSLVLVFITSIGFSQMEVATQSLKDFDKLVISGKFKVEIIQSDRNEAEVEILGEEAILEKLKFSYKGKTLTINYKGSFVKDIPLKLTLYVPNTVVDLEARKGVQITMREVGEVEKLDYYVDSGSKILAQNIHANEIYARISKGGSIQLTGVANFFYPKINAGGTIAAVNLHAKNVEASVSMGGEVLCTPTEKLDAKVTSGGTISYTGTPKLSQSITLGGKIEQL